jgi:FKBP-type peptidyl-prolyl cis-trans isomerase FklB
MRFQATVAVIALAASSFAAEPALQNDKEKVSYSIGVNIGGNLKKQLAGELSVDHLVAGLKDSFAGSKLQLNEEEMGQVLQAFQKQMGEKSLSKQKEEGEKNSKAGEAFLAENKKKEGVVTLPSGLQYKVVKQGAGAIPKASDTVVTHYRGTLIDGTEFDSSYKRNEPAKFPVNGVIKGWTEALQLMKAGSKWQLFIPSALAYGEQGAGGDIPPNATLLFDIELIEVAK